MAFDRRPALSWHLKRRVVISIGPGGLLRPTSEEEAADGKGLHP
jgi:hypothetical protein